MSKHKYRVVENSGMEKEWPWPNKFDDYFEAQKFIKTKYEEDEVASLYVEIAVELPDGSLTYDF